MTEEISPATGGWRVGRIGFPTAAPSVSFVATLLYTLDLAPEDITQDFDGNRQDLWRGWWDGEGNVEGITASETEGVIAYLAPGTYSITLNWVGVLLTGEPIHGVDPLPTPNVGMWVGPLAGFQGVSVPFGGGGQGTIVSPTESAIVTVTNSAYTELHVTTLNKQDDSTIYMPAGITVTITRF